MHFLAFLPSASPFLCRRAMRGLLVGLWLGVAVVGHAAEAESMAERSLKRIGERQREIFANAAKQGDNLNEATLRTQLQQLTHDYELLLRENPKFAAAYAAYGLLLSKVDMRKESMAMLLKADQLDSQIAIVKNQLGNLLAEEGRPLAAAAYFLAAVKLEPKEPLYHYQLGSLLVEARDDFLKSGDWTRSSLDQAMQQAFRQATELAPDRFEFAYRHAESFYDLEKPDWEAALKAWSALEEKAPSAIERQTMRLHAANILIKQGKIDHAQLLLATVDEKDLQGQKQKLVAQMDQAGKK